jgi:hypothetical protein
MKTAQRFGVCTVLIACLVGCNSKPGGGPRGAARADKAGEVEDHSHGTGPHGGTVADWGGGKYHVEFCVNHDKQEATVYLLKGDATTPAPIKTDKLLLSIKDPVIQVELQAVPLEGDSPGACSRFVGKHERLGKEQEFAGTISGEIDGKPYAGDFKEEPDHPESKGGKR